MIKTFGSELHKQRSVESWHSKIWSKFKLNIEILSSFLSSMGYFSSIWVPSNTSSWDWDGFLQPKMDSNISVTKKTLLTFIENSNVELELLKIFNQRFGICRGKWNICKLTYQLSINHFKRNFIFDCPLYKLNLFAVDFYSRMWYEIFSIALK